MIEKNTINRTKQKKFLGEREMKKEIYAISFKKKRVLCAAYKLRKTIS